MRKLKEKPNHFNDITIPRITTSRKVIYFDESGEEKMPNIEIAYDSPDRYFIYTAVTFNNYDVENLENYYFNLKRKYLGGICEIHSTEFFRRPTQNRILFTKALAEFMDTLPFLYITVIVDKKVLFDSSSSTKIKKPMETTFKKALGIHTEKGFLHKDFYDKSIREILRMTSNHSMRDISDYYPLNLAYKTILEMYFQKLLPQYFKPVFKNWDHMSAKTELKFETSPNKERILKLTENFRSEDSDLGKMLKNNMFDISFPFKKALYMGLEIADIISYGYNLQKYKRLTQTPMYRPIRKVLLRRNKVVKKEMGIDCVIEKKKRG